MRLYELTNQFKEIERMEDLDDQTMLDTLESIEGAFLDKGRNVAAYFQNLDADVNALKDAENKIAARRKSIENKSNSLKEYLLRNMQALDITKIECPEFSITLRKPSQVVDVFAPLHNKYLNEKTTVTPDKRLIAADLKAGIEVAGARLIDSKQSLTIK